MQPTLGLTTALTNAWLTNESCECRGRVELVWRVGLNVRALVLKPATLEDIKASCFLVLRVALCFLKAMVQLFSGIPFVSCWGVCPLTSANATNIGRI